MKGNILHIEVLGHSKREAPVFLCRLGFRMWDIRFLSMDKGPCCPSFRLG